MFRGTSISLSEAFSFTQKLSWCVSGKEGIKHDYPLKLKARLSRISSVIFWKQEHAFSDLKKLSTLAVAVQRTVDIVKRGL